MTATFYLRDEPSLPEADETGRAVRQYTDRPLGKRLDTARRIVIVGREWVSIAWSDENRSKKVEARNLSAVEGSLRYCVRIHAEVEADMAPE